MRILIIHNQLWAHYKSRLFSEIHHSLKEISPGSDLLVVQIALFESSRSAMQDQGDFQYSYPYKVLFERSLDQVGFQERFRSLLKAFHEFKPTVLNITGYFDWAQVLLMVYAKRKGVKIVISSESSSADSIRSAIKEKIKSLILSQADAFFCFGKTSADYLLGLGVQPAQIKVANAAVVDEEVILTNYQKAREEIRKNEQPAAKRNFVFVGRLAPEKNLEMLINAFVNLQNNLSETQSWGLLFVGDGPSRERLEKLASKSQNPANFFFEGGFPWYRVPEWLAKSDVLVLPSLSEPWGLVVNEAMVCGMPVVVSKNCGCAEDLVKNGKNGFSFDPKHQQELENSLRFFIENPEKIVAMGQESSAIIQGFQSKGVAMEMTKSYISL